MNKKLIGLIILEIIILICGIGYCVYAEIENGLSVSDTPNIFEPLGRTIPSGGTEEYKYEHEGDYYTLEKVKTLLKRINGTLRKVTNETPEVNTNIEKVLKEKAGVSLFCVRQRTRYKILLWLFP